MKQRKSSGIKPVSEVSFGEGTYFLRMKMHDVAGKQTISWEGAGSNGSVSGDLTPDGTKANIFANQGEFTNFGDNGTVLLPADGDLFDLLNDLWRTDNLDGTIMGFIRFSRNTTTGDKLILAHNNHTSVTNGFGWGLMRLNSGRFRLNHNNLGVSVLSSSGDAMDSINTPVHVGFYLQSAIDSDVAIGIAINGANTISNTIPKAEKHGLSPHQGLFCYPSDSDTVTGELELNERASEMLFIRFTTNEVANFEKYGVELKDLRGDLIWGLDGK